MTSFVSSLKRGLSMGRDSQLSTPRAGSMPNSPSFSDFSLGAEMEAEHELWKARSQKPLEAQNRPAVQGESWSTMFGSTSPRDVPKAQEVPSEPISQSLNTNQNGPRRRRPEGKIGGMSYYDYHDLIRSSSL